MKNATVSLVVAAAASLLAADKSRSVIKRAIPRTGEELPVVGLGSSARTGRLVAQLLQGATPDIDLAPFSPQRFAARAA